MFISQYYAYSNMIFFLKNYCKGITKLCVEMYIGCILAYSDTDIIKVV